MFDVRISFFPLLIIGNVVLCSSIVTVNFIRNMKNLFDKAEAFGRSAKMGTKQKQVNTKPRQFSIMVDFMKQHSELAKGPIKGLVAKQTSDQLWRRLAEELNQNGPPKHNFVEWKKIWADYKNHIKSKLRKNKINMSGTGGGPSQVCSLTSIEEEVVTLMSLDDAVNGTPRTERFGVSEDSAAINVLPTPSINALPEDGASEMNEGDHDNDMNVEGDRMTVRPRPLTTRGVHENLLREQVKNQMEYQKEHLKKLDKVCDILQTTSRYERKNYELKKDKFEFKKQKEKERAKLALRKLELKEKILEQELLRLQ